MSGSGSTTFAIVNEMKTGETLRENVLSQFGSGCWTALVSIT
jgi:4-diphosphocytidyl-2C-methyl-D-erythritol kinase